MDIKLSVGDDQYADTDFILDEGDAMVETPIMGCIDMGNDEVMLYNQ